MIRFIFAAGFLSLFLILSLPVLGAEWIIGRFDRSLKDRSSLRIVQWAFRVILRISGVSVTVIGEENVPDEPVLFIGNHRSYFDILLTYTRVRRLTGYVSKKSMESFPILSIWMKYLYCLFLDRDDIKAGLKTILKAIDYIRNGISIFIFPEGTRNKGEETSLLPFKEGSFKIAAKTGCAIVPVSINNSAEIFENHLPRLKPVHVVVEYGRPVYPDKLPPEDKKHIGAYCQAIVKETLARNSTLV